MTLGRSRAGHTRWIIASATVSLLVIVPVAVVLANLARDSGGVWEHLAETRLAEYVGNTIFLGIAVTTIATIIGVATAWLLTACRFPGCGVLTWAQLLPLAVPGYIAAYAMTDLLQFAGPVQTALRSWTGWAGGEYWFPAVRSLPGATVILAMSLYPYVFFAARASFLTLPTSVLEAGRTLGRGSLGTFLSVAMPLAGPAIAASSLLVVMETVADFGTADYCAVDTLATGIYRTWLGLDSIVGAAQLSSLLLMGVLVLIVAESVARGRRRFHQTAARDAKSHRRHLRGFAGIGALAACALPVLLGFALPAGRLLWLAVSSWDPADAERLLGHGRNTVALAGISSVLAVSLAVIVVFTKRLHVGRLPRAIAVACRMGYAIPGPVIAIGLLLALGWIDHRINDASRWLRPDSALPGLLLTGSVAALLIGYQTRFLAVALAVIDTGMLRINRKLDDAARGLGARPGNMLARIHAPLLRASLFAAGLLVFVDVVKELPATLMLRPFNVDTLAVRVYQLASDERLDSAAPAALAIVVVGVLPAIVLHRLLARPLHGQARSRPEQPDA